MPATAAISRVRNVDQLPVLFCDDIIDALALQRVSNHPAEPAVADQHHLPAQPLLHDRGRQFGQRIVRPLKLARRRRL